MCWSDRAILDGYQCMMINSRRWLTLSGRQKLPLGGSEKDKHIRKKRIGFFPLWLILFCYLWCIFWKAMLWEEQGHFVGRSIETLLICLVLLLVMGVQEKAGQLNFPEGCGLVGLLVSPTNVSNLHQHFHSDCPTMQGTSKSLCVAICWKIKRISKADAFFPSSVCAGLDELIY